MVSIEVKRNHLSISPRKVRQVCDLIRRRPVSEALNVLRYCDKKDIAVELTKLINNGLSVAVGSDKYDIDNLVVDTLMVNEGPTMKRIQPRAQGRAFRIRHRSSHVYMKLAEKV